MGDRPQKNPHFRTVESWAEAEAMLRFRPRVPRETAGCELQTLEIHVRDHNKRELSPETRSLEAHYGAFVVSQALKKGGEAKRAALSMAYGSDARSATVCNHEGRMYELGPEPPPGDIDGRSPAVVTWADGDLFFLIASDRLAAAALLDVATSMYPPPGR